MPPTDDDLISAQEAGEMLDVTGARVREYVRAGRLRAQMVGTSYVFRRGDVRAFKPLPTGRPPVATATPASKRRRKGKGKASAT